MHITCNQTKGNAISFDKLQESTFDLDSSKWLYFGVHGQFTYFRQAVINITSKYSV